MEVKRRGEKTMISPGGGHKIARGVNNVRRNIIRGIDIVDGRCVLSASAKEGG